MTAGAGKSWRTRWLPTEPSLAHENGFNRVDYG